MKYKFVLAILVAIILSAIEVFGQDKPSVPDSVVVKSELLKKYEAGKKNIQELLDKRIDELAKADAVCNQLIGMRSNYEKLIKELKPKNKEAQK